MRRALMLLVAVSCSSGPPEDCAQIGTTARTFSDSTLQSYASGCTRHADCVLLKPKLTCYNGCPTGVLASRESNAVLALMGLSEMVCGSGTCSINEGCNPVHAECVQSSCKAVAGAATGDAGSPDGG